MCVGGFPDAVRRQAKRGRPKKNRPEMEDRVKKANKTRRALASAASSSSGGSPPSEFHSPAGQSPLPHTGLEFIETTELPGSMTGVDNFGDPLSSSTDPFG